MMVFDKYHMYHGLYFFVVGSAGLEDLYLQIATP
jgi:hypothetical protein